MSRHSGGVVSVRTSDLLRLAGGIQAVFLAVMLLEYVGFDTGLVRPLVVVLYVAFVPGGIVALVFRIADSLASFIAYALGLSLFLVMMIGVLLSLALPPLGIARPLSLGPLSVALTSIVIASGRVLFNQEPEFLFEIRLGALLSPTPLVLLLLPPASILGTVLLKQGENLPLLALLVIVSVIPLGFVFFSDVERWGALGVWTVSVALVYHGGLWPFRGGHQFMQIVLNEGRWIPNYADGLGSLVSNGVMYPVFAILTGFPMSVEWGVVNPFLISFIPFVLFELFRRETSPLTAFLGCCLFMFSFPFYTLYPGGGRVSTPILFLALLGLAVVDKRNESPIRNALIAVFAVGVAVSHYGTAWVVMVALLTSITVFYAIRFLSMVFSSGDKELWPRVIKLSSPLFSKVLSPSAVGFYVVFALSWYLYTGLGGKFKTLPNHVVDGFMKIFFGDATGDAVRSATHDYGSTSITISRWLYILIGALMGLGVALVFLRRIVIDERVVSDEYLALGAGFLAMLAAAFLPFSSGFNTARVMMIVFTFSAPFAVLGLRSAVEFTSKKVSLIDMDRKASFAVPTAIATLLTVFLLLNAGVVSATITDDYAPSNTLLQEQLRNSDDPIEQTRADLCTECAIQLQIWVWNNRDPAIAIYADFQTRAQIDYHRGTITEATGTVPTKAALTRARDAPTGPENTSYVLLPPHNMVTGVIFIGSKYNWTTMEVLNESLQGSDRLYHSKNAVVHRTAPDRLGRTNSTVSRAGT